MWFVAVAVFVAALVLALVLDGTLAEELGLLWLGRPCFSAEEVMAVLTALSNLLLADDMSKKLILVTLGVTYCKRYRHPTS